MCNHLVGSCHKSDPYSLSALVFGISTWPVGIDSHEHGCEPFCIILVLLYTQLCIGTVPSPRQLNHALHLTNSALSLGTTWPALNLGTLATPWYSKGVNLTSDSQKMVELIFFSTG